MQMVNAFLVLKIDVENSSMTSGQITHHSKTITFIRISLSRDQCKSRINANVSKQCFPTSITHYDMNHNHFADYQKGNLNNQQFINILLYIDNTNSLNDLRLGGIQLTKYLTNYYFLRASNITLKRNKDPILLRISCFKTRHECDITLVI